MTQQPTPPNQVRIELPANLTPTYANAALVTQSHSEIIVDLIQVMPNDPRARIVSRVVMTPANAKLLMQALAQNLERYEDKHGDITLPPKPISLAEQLFDSAKPRNGDGNDDE